MPPIMIHAALFTLSATALLGSPGPGIAALVSVGRSRGWLAGLRFYAGLQLGLALAAATVALGLYSVFEVFPALLQAMRWLAIGYLLILACQVAIAPTGTALQGGTGSAASALAGVLLGIANPKAYIAFATLFASRVLLPANPAGDLVLKFALSVAVMLIVDLAWLLIGVALHGADLTRRTERMLNLIFAAMILAAALPLI